MLYKDFGNGLTSGNTEKDNPCGCPIVGYGILDQLLQLLHYPGGNSGINPKFGSRQNFPNFISPFENPFKLDIIPFLKTPLQIPHQGASRV